MFGFFRLLLQAWGLLQIGPERGLADIVDSVAGAVDGAVVRLAKALAVRATGGAAGIVAIRPRTRVAGIARGGPGED